MPCSTLSLARGIYFLMCHAQKLACEVNYFAPLNIAFKASQCQLNHNDKLGFKIMVHLDLKKSKNFFFFFKEDTKHLKKN